jgi:hypothetical protein
MSKTVGKRKASRSTHDRHQHEEVRVISEEVTGEAVRAFCQVLKRRGWGALVSTISALVLEGTPYNDEDEAGEYARVDAWLRGWITSPYLPEPGEVEPHHADTPTGRG